MSTVLFFYMAIPLNHLYKSAKKEYNKKKKGKRVIGNGKKEENYA